MRKLFTAFIVSVVFATSVNAQCTDPSSYYDAEPEHIVAPLSDMVFRPNYLSDYNAEFIPEIEISEEERDLLAALVYHESGNQDLLGKQYVVDVVLNRVESDLFPNNITDVIFQKNPIQFTTAEYLYSISNNVTDECYDAVDLELAERTNREILYFNNSSNVSGTFVFKHGGHWFGK